jgi:hypothetical protein
MSNENTTNTNSNNNLFSDLNSTDILFINILNTIYNDNLRIINQLLDQNNEIRQNLVNFMTTRRMSSFTSIFNDNINQQANNIHNTNINPNDRRIFIDNIPYYIVDEVQFFTIPLANNNNPNTLNTGNNVNNHNINLNDRQRTRSRTNRNRFSHRHHDHTHSFNWEPNDTFPTPIGRMTGIMNSFFQPVTIRPTLIQIENATFNVTYGDIVNPINTSCPISLETFLETSEVTMIKHCKHIFNRQNLMSWFNSNCKCPVCRYDIRDYVNIDNNGNDNNNETQNENSTSTSNNSNASTQDTIRNIRNIRNITEQTNSILESLFQDALYDLSNNNIQFPFR